MLVFAFVALLGAVSAFSSPMPFDLSGHTIMATFHAEGAQIYECKAGVSGGAPAWAFREPIATLMANGKTVGRHFAGPRWALDDGSLLQGRLLRSVPGATALDVPLLDLDVIQNAGRGRLSQVTKVYRLKTQAGALQGNCAKVGSLQSVSYSADYAFAQ